MFRLVARLCGLLTLVIGGVLAICLAAAPILPAGPQIAFMANPAFNWDIYGLDLRTGVILRLTSAPFVQERYPDWSPDGERIAYHANPGRDYDLFVMDADGSNAQRLNLSLQITYFDEAMPDWSPDGTQLGFHSGTSDIGYNLFISDAGGMGFIPVTNGAGDFYHFNWSPSGEQIAFVGAYDRNEGIFLLDLGPGITSADDNMQRVEAVAENGFFPAWSPDGQHIAFVSARTGSEDIYLVDLANSAIRNLTNSPLADDTHPAWSADGRHIVFASNRGGTFDLYMMTSDGDNLRRLTYLYADVLAPDWRPGS
ncbi:MAG: TolB family protein [Chloroflexota bacterium]